ncbi:MAG: HEPN domain-containing protein [Candidatus Sericytochromatia bacterium]|nr:HEPN domain-containing protein [Candidatus Tanganyikabacteria bacterium]
MSPEVAEILEWLQRADTDLRTARKALAEPDSIPEAAVFHCQQAVEKALKAFLTWRERPFGKTHNLAELGAECATLDASLASLVPEISPLTQFAWRYRYPGAPVGLPADEAREVLAIAERTVAAVRQRLPEVSRQGS